MHGVMHQIEMSSSGNGELAQLQVPGSCSLCSGCVQDRDSRLDALKAENIRIARARNTLEQDRHRLQRECARLKMMLGVDQYGSDSCA